MKLLVSEFAAVALALALAVAPAPARAGDDGAVAKDNFKELCVKCHGDNGHGDGPAAATLETKPGDLTDCAKMSRLSDEMMLKVIRDGGPAAGLSRAMGRFGDGLEDDEIKMMVVYVRTFCAK